MTINTQFNPGQEVYFIDGNTIKKLPILKVEISILCRSNKSKEEPLIIYYFNDNIYKYESEIAANTEDLILKLTPK